MWRGREGGGAGVAALGLISWVTLRGIAALGLGWAGLVGQLAALADMSSSFISSVHS